MKIKNILGSLVFILLLIIIPSCSVKRYHGERIERIDMYILPNVIEEEGDTIVLHPYAFTKKGLLNSQYTEIVRFNKKKTKKILALVKKMENSKIEGKQINKSLSAYKFAYHALLRGYRSNGREIFSVGIQNCGSYILNDSLVYECDENMVKELYKIAPKIRDAVSW